MYKLVSNGSEIFTCDTKTELLFNILLNYFGDRNTNIDVDFNKNLVVLNGVTYTIEVKQNG